MTVLERWYGQGDEVGGLHTRTRVGPTCLMVLRARTALDDGTCGKPATVRANAIDRPKEEMRRYPSDIYWCAEHAAMIMEVQ